MSPDTVGAAYIAAFPASQAIWLGNEALEAVFRQFPPCGWPIPIGAPVFAVARPAGEAILATPPSTRLPYEMQERRLSLALFEPDIPQNTGAILRLAACMGVTLHVIEPCGFVLDDRRMRRAGMDYLELAALVRHDSWQAFLAARPFGRLVLLTTAAENTYAGHAYRHGDCLLFGRESAGVPQDVHDVADIRLRIPMLAGLRSINVANAAAMVLGEALRQTDGFPR